jgi:hypothetical protein
MNKAIAADAATLKLHVAAGQVWQTAGTELAHCTDMTPDEYAKTATRWEKFDVVRLMGIYDNAPLICSLFGRTRVELITPLVCPSSSLRKDPQASLYYMRSCHLAPSQGGYHAMTPTEALVYRACAAARASKRIEDAVVHLQAHPVWRPLNFLTGLNPSFLASILVAVLDPRWFIDTRAPDRSEKLTGYFGLDLATQAGVLGLGKPQRSAAKCKLAMHVWYVPEVAREVLTRHLQLGGLVAVFNATERGLVPGDMLWRIWISNYDRWRDDPNKAAIYGTVRASQALLKFLRLVWLATIYHNSASIPDGGAGLFRPRDFFRSTVEAQAFEKWIA